MQSGDREPNSKYYLEEYFNIAYSKHPHFIYIIWLQLHPEFLPLESLLDPSPNLPNFLNLNQVLKNWFHN